MGTSFVFGLGGGGGKEAGHQLEEAGQKWGRQGSRAVEAIKDIRRRDLMRVGCPAYPVSPPPSPPLHTPAGPH